jgi:hypothetical protein
MRNNYKQIYACQSMYSKRGQLAIFIIVSIVIVGIIVVFFLFPQANIFVSQDLNPSAYLRDCVEPSLDEILPIVSAQGGYSEPDHFVLYQGKQIQYLCYSANNYETCKVQQPLLKRHVEEEIKRYVEPRAQQCIRDLNEEYERKGFTVSTTPGEVEVSFVPGSLIVDFQSKLVVSKESTQTFDKFAISLDSEMYDLLLTATNIIQYEAALGDSETTLYLQFYPDLKIEKIKRDGNTIYTLSNVVTGESFTFASRSLVWPPGYGLEDL